MSSVTTIELTGRRLSTTLRSLWEPATTAFLMIHQVGFSLGKSWSPTSFMMQTGATSWSVVLMQSSLIMTAKTASDSSLSPSRRPRYATGSQSISYQTSRRGTRSVSHTRSSWQRHCHHRQGQSDQARDHLPHFPVLILKDHGGVWHRWYRGWPDRTDDDCQDNYQDDCTSWLHQLIAPV